MASPAGCRVRGQRVYEKEKRRSHSQSTPESRERKCTQSCREKRTRENSSKRANEGDVQAPVVQRLDRAIHQINIYPVDSAISFPITYPLDSDLSGG